MTDNPRDCEHGNLARSCIICLLTAELCEARDQLAQDEVKFTHQNIQLVTLREENARMREKAEVVIQSATEVRMAIKKILNAFNLWHRKRIGCDFCQYGFDAGHNNDCPIGEALQSAREVGGLFENKEKMK